MRVRIHAIALVWTEFFSLARRPRLAHTLKCKSYETLHFASTSETLFIQLDRLGRRRLKTFSAGEDVDGDAKGSILWAAKDAALISPNITRLTSVLPLDLDCIIFGYSEATCAWYSIDLTLVTLYKRRRLHSQIIPCSNSGLCLPGIWHI